MFKVNKGSILIYRVFDIADEIDLDKVKKKLNLFAKEDWSIRPSSKPSIIVKSPPVNFKLNEHIFEINEKKLRTEVSLKIWDYGVCSICFSIVADNFNVKDLINLQNALEKVPLIDEVAKEKVTQLFNEISESLKNPKIWNIFEDYTLVLAQKLSKTDDEDKIEESIEPKEIIEKYSSDIAHLLVGENKEQLSESMIKDILSQKLQYSTKDLAIIDWNSAFVIDPSGSSDIPDLIEFVLTHQLEIRYYNHLVEYQKEILYKNLNNKTAFLSFSNLFLDISSLVSQKFLEFSDMIRKLDNSIETVGDFYLAKVIEATNYKFNSKIRANLDANLSELQNEAERLGSKTQTTQSNFLSLLIIILIVIELLLPLVKGIGGH
jgi:hypothetical protein